MYVSKPSLLALLPWLLLAPGLAAHAAEPRLALPHSAAPAAALRGARALGQLPAGQTLTLALTLPLRNQSGLDALVKAQYTPGDPLYHHFLTRDQFTAQFGPTEADYETAAQWAQSQGLTITGTSATRTLLNVSGSAAQVQTAFGVTMNRYRLPSGRTAYAASAASLPFSVAGCISGVVGLNNLAQMRPSLLKRSGAVHPSAGLRPNALSGTFGYGPLGFLAPNDVKYAYGLSTITPLYGPVTVGGLNGVAYSPATPTTTTVDPTTGAAATSALLDGTGQTVGLFELDGFDSKDTDQYITAFSLPSITAAAAAKATPPGTPTVQTVLIGGYNGTTLGGGQGEVTLDIDMVLALAPKATIISYEADQTANPTATVDTYQRMANDVADDGTPLLQVISTSWGAPETLLDQVTLTQENAIFQQMAAQGQTIYDASGDNGAYDAYGFADPTQKNSIVIDDPASQPYMTGVGGTTLKYKKPSTNATTGVTTPGQYLGEVVWNTGKLNSLGGPEGGGGGSSQIWPKPIYQIGYGTSPNRRDAPDVSLNSDPSTGYDLFLNGAPVTIGGTSAAAPLWAGFTALINQQRAANGLPSLGFLNPQLYPLLSDTTYTSLFHDITVGDNLLYQAQPGYDDATGLGTFIGSALLSRLSFSANAGTGTATLSGTVTDATTGAAIGGAIVSAVGASGVVRGTATTDTTGAYSLTAPAGVSLTVTASVASTTATPTGTTPTGTTPTLPTIGTGTTTGSGTVYAGQSVSGVTLAAGGTSTLNFALSPAHAFAAGLQMISAPYDYTGVGDFAALFGLTTPLTATSPRLIQWQPGPSTYKFYPTAPADTIRLGQGYWVRFTQPSYISKAGVPAPATQPYSISLTAGWNQIGDPFNGSISLSGATVSTAAGGSTTSLAASTLVQPIAFSFNTATGVYDQLDPTLGTLTPYLGYWIYARQNSILALPVPADLPPPSIPIAPIQ